mgnify:CR=1 FL=1
MITLTTEQAQQIEEALDDIVRVFEFETGTPVEALAAIREALDHSGDSNEMVMGWSKVKPEAIKSDPMYQMGYAAAKAEPVRTKDLTAQEKANIIYAADHRNPMAMIDAAIALYREKNR